jgi:hypothetical protein
MTLTIRPARPPQEGYADADAAVYPDDINDNMWLSRGGGRYYHARGGKGGRTGEGEREEGTGSGKGVVALTPGRRGCVLFQHAKLLSSAAVGVGQPWELALLCLPLYLLSALYNPPPCPFAPLRQAQEAVPARSSSCRARCGGLAGPERPGAVAPPPTGTYGRHTHMHESSLTATARPVAQCRWAAVDDGLRPVTSGRAPGQQAQP